MKAESIFMYMCISALLLTPIAIYMTDFSHPINWGFKGPWLAAGIQVLNSIGALTLVYALRHGNAIVVVPLTGLSPVNHHRTFFNNICCDARNCITDRADTGRVLQFCY